MSVKLFNFLSLYLCVITNCIEKVRLWLQIRPFQDTIIITELPEVSALGTKPGVLPGFFIWIRKCLRMDLKKPLSFKEQLERLREHGAEILNDEYAINILSHVNYYRLTGYALQFRKSEHDSDYITGTNFDTIWNIYQFDEKLRHILRLYIEKTEVFYRTLISNQFAKLKCTTAPYDQHYDENNYYFKSGFREVKEKLNKEIDNFKDSLFVQHHKNKYSYRMPIWVCVELMSFSNLSKFYNCMYNTDKEIIAKCVGTGPKTLSNHLHCLSVLRNKCAHATRLYNIEYNPPASFSKSFLRSNPEIRNDTLFAYILVLLRRLPEDNDRLNLISEITMLVNEYQNYIDLDLIGFPQHYRDIFSKLFNSESKVLVLV